MPDIGFRLLPDRLNNILRDIFYVKLHYLTKETLMKTPLYNHLIKSAKKMATVFENAGNDM